MAESPPEDRCAYSYDVSTLHGIGATQCWRPVMEGQERCVWHADIEEKSLETLDDEQPRAPERLDGAHLEHSVLNDVDWFEECTLIGAEFTAADVRDTSFADADLREATFDTVDAQGTNFAGANLEGVSFVGSDLRGATLERTRLDHTVFSNVRISYSTDFGDKTVYERELAGSDDPERTGQAAIWAYHQLRALHQDNALPIKARRYHLREKDVRRRVAWATGRYFTALWSETSRWVTGYGMSPWRVLITALVVVILSAFLYPTTGGLVEPVGSGEGGETITWSVEEPGENPAFFFGVVFFRSLYFSIVTFTTLGYGDIRPIGDVARAIAGIEAVLGQALLALLVFVLSRRIR
jgi:hypothetical protein